MLLPGCHLEAGPHEKAAFQPGCGIPLRALGQICHLSETPAFRLVPDERF